MTKPACDQSYLGRVFDSYQNNMQIARCLREAGRQRSITRPRVLELSRRLTGIQDYFPEGQFVRHATHENDQPTLTMPVALPFSDKSFDACLVTDAYEHVPAEMRPSLLGEMLRVTRGLVLIGCPQGNEIVNRFDRIVFDFIWGKYGERFEPLEQHIEFGLDPLEKVLASLRDQGADKVVALPCNYVYRWIHQILIYFDMQHRHRSRDVFEALNRIYNERLSPYDYREPCYRYLIVVATDPGVDVEALARTLKGPCETPASVAETEGVLTEAFRAAETNAADRLQRCSDELEQLRAIVLQRERPKKLVKRMFSWVFRRTR